eukprot:1464421-Prorocentrum_lima.AAC.1
MLGPGVSCGLRWPLGPHRLRPSDLPFLSWALACSSGWHLSWCRGRGGTQPATASPAGGPVKGDGR